MTISLSGIGVSRGIAIGKAHVLERGQPEVTEAAIPQALIEEEVQRLEQALQEARDQLSAIRTRIPTDAPQDIAAFIDTHLLMLKDTALTTVPIDLIRTRQCNAEWALKLQRDALVQIFEEMDDAYLRTRKDDVIHVVNRILRLLLNEQDQHHNQASHNLEGAIIIADELTPADTVLLQHQGIAAFVTEFGGPLSHTAIMARSLRIPAVVGVHHARRYIRNEEEVIVDGRQGALIALPDEHTSAHYAHLTREEDAYFASLNRLVDAPCVSRDQIPISLYGNIELPSDVDGVLTAHGEGVGLFRTEFLFMNRDTLPDEEEQFEAYTQVAQHLSGKTLTIRTLDLGADKQTDDGHSGLATNPALGLRAIRLCLKDPTLFKPQLRAILRTSAQAPVRLMIPMVSNSQEMFQSLQMIEQVKKECRAEGIEFDENLPVGVMIEVPAAAITASTFAQHLDFLSIGTNDLIQYTLAIDRIDDEVNYLYDPLHPAVLRLIHQVIKAGRRAGIPVSMCGEMAGDPRYTRLLLGLGLREFSMQPASLLEVKDVILRSELGPLTRPVRHILTSTNAEQIRHFVDSLNNT